MPVIAPSDQQVLEITCFQDKAPNFGCWISTPGGLTRFGAFVQVLQPQTRSSIEHWHRDEDALVYGLDGELTVVEGGQGSLLRPAHRPRDLPRSRPQAAP